jgi:galactonate dehydratase
MKKIATLAEAYTVPLAPHCSQSYLGMTASFHVSAAVPHFLIHESYDDAMFDRFIHPNWTKTDGYATLPDGVGLGVDIDVAEMQRLAADPSFEYHWRGPRFLPDGSVSDY